MGEAKSFPDRWGVPVQAGGAESVAVLNTAIEDLAALAGDPVGGAEKAAADGDLVLARIYQAILFLYATTPASVAAAARILDDLDEAGLPERETYLLRAARAWAGGDWAAATRWLERDLLAHPRDLLALKVAQDLYFFLGNRLELRDCAARVLPHWPRGEPGWGYVQGIYAFGLEENADYRQAQTRAQAALDVNPLDVWSVHALAHVHEMEGSYQAGAEFLASTSPSWSGSYFAVHNWWHKGLYHLELLELDTVLALYDDPIRAVRSTEWLDVVDAAALLWRLRLFGVDVTGRARQLAADIDELVAGPVYIFNDWHAVMAFALAGDLARAERVLAANRRLTAPANALMAERAGLRLLEAFIAFAAGRPADTVERLIDIRQHANAVGGSHAQRDVIDLTLIAAAARSGDQRLAGALVAERVARKPPAEPSARELAAVNTPRRVDLVQPVELCAGFRPLSPREADKPGGSVTAATSAPPLTRQNAR
jgi:tetratricopeptide (TPR) repeat protein